jgi:hypothetical protein
MEQDSQLARYRNDGPALGLLATSTKAEDMCGLQNGPGIPPKIEDSVFELFVSYGKVEGRLGLAIAKKIVEDQWRELYLRSRFFLPFPEGAIPRAVSCVDRIHIGDRSNGPAAGAAGPFAAAFTTFSRK